MHHEICVIPNFIQGISFLLYAKESPDMNFSYLEYAVAVAHYGSVSKAARSLFLSQPYLSSVIRSQIQSLGPRLKALPISMSMYVLLPPAHPLAGASSLTLEEIRGWPYVSYDDSSSIRYLNQLNLSNNPRLLKVSDRGSFYDALNSGSYLSLMAFSRPNASVGLTIIPISGKSLRLAAGYVIEKRRQLTGREKAFLSFLNNGIS